MGILLAILVLGGAAFVIGSLFGGKKDSREKRTVIHHYQDPETGESKERVEEQIIETQRPLSATEATKSGCSTILWVVIVIVVLLIFLVATSK